MSLSDFLFGKNKWDIDKEYDTSIRNAKKIANKAMMEDAYNKAFVNQSENNASIARDAGLDVNAIRNNNWDKFTDDNGNTQTYSGYIKALQNEQDKAWAKNKYNVLGNGAIGTIATPFIQVADISKDMLASPFRAMAGEETNRYIRDPENNFLSDVGAIGETAFDVAGMGALGDAVKGGAKLMSNVGKTALRTGALGAGENAFSTLREQGSDADLRDIALSGAIGGAIGGALGGGSQLFGNAKAISSLSPSKAVGPYTGGINPAVAKAKYANAADALGVSLENLSEDALRTARNNSMKNIARNVGYETAEGQAQRMATNNAYQELLDMLNGKTVAGAPVSTGPVNIPFSQRMQNLKTYAAGTPIAKFGQTTRNILKTPAGKIGAGVGGGLLIANLLRGGGQPNTEMTDEELYQLLNNYNNGGY